MSDGYVGEVRAFAFDFQPAGWLPCDGRLLPIMENQKLFSLLGTVYGGNGETTFALPELPPMRTSDQQNGLGWCIATDGAYPTRG